MLPDSVQKCSDADDLQNGKCRNPLVTSIFIIWHIFYTKNYVIQCTDLLAIKIKFNPLQFSC